MPRRVRWHVLEQAGKLVAERARRTFVISSVVRFSVPLTMRKTRSASRRRASSAAEKPLALKGETEPRQAPGALAGEGFGKGPPVIDGRLDLLCGAVVAETDGYLADALHIQQPPVGQFSRPAPRGQGVPPGRG